MDANKIAEFRNLVESKPELVARLKGKTDPALFAEEAAKIAAENGYAISAAEIAALLKGSPAAANDELTDDQLARVSGGGAMTIEDTVCMKLYGWCPGQ